MRTVLTAVLAAVAVAGCGAAPTQSAPLAVATSTSPAHTAAPRAVRPAATPEQPGPWPDTRTRSAVSCVAEYPSGLGRHANAVDATVTAVAVGGPTVDGHDRPATIDLAVHEVFAGRRRTQVRMKTWDFMLPQNPRRILGYRILAAAGETLDVKGCGYTRPYSAADAALWRATFRRTPEPAG